MQGAMQEARSPALIEGERSDMRRRDRFAIGAGIPYS